MRHKLLHHAVQLQPTLALVEQPLPPPCKVPSAQLTLHMHEGFHTPPNHAFAEHHTCVQPKLAAYDL